MYLVEHQGADLLNEVIELRVTMGSGADADQLRNLQIASRHRQIFMVKEDNGEPLASIAYAKISRYTLRLAVANQEYELCPYEFREGKIIYVVDGFFKKGYFKKALKKLTHQLKKHRIIAYKRNGRVRMIKRKDGAFRLVKPVSIV